MPHFPIKIEEIKEDLIEINSNNDNFFHITKVLRIKQGESIKFIDEQGFVYYSKVLEVSKNLLRAQIINKEKSPRALKTPLSLIQCVLAPDGQSLLIANATQTGVKKIYPVVSDNTSAKPKVDKWNKIAQENFKQCERADFVQIEPVNKLIPTLEKFDTKQVLVFAEKEVNISLDEAIKNIDKTQEIAVVIGPEGGFSNNEFEYFKNNNYKLITLGSMIYKAPNAVVAAISNVISRIEP